MHLEILSIVILTAIFLFYWKTKNRGNIKQSTEDLEDPKVRAVTLSAERYAQIINESIQIASESKNAETKISRLEVAKNNLEELKKLSEKFSFIKLERLSGVELTIQKLELEFEQRHYREAASGNLRGKELEKEGQVDDAIEIYEQLLSANIDTPFTYKRLAIIYSKRKQKDEELRVIKAALQNVPAENSAHYKWFADRLAKKS